jgi:hypothetical protein
MQKPQIFLNHLGYLRQSKKQIIVEDCDYATFEIQDMMISEVESLDGHENWKTVFEGTLEKKETEMGTFLIGDFSQLTRAGLYRAVLPGVASHSFQFFINDGTFHQLPRLFLDFIHNRRSGNFENDFRGPSHLDDAVRSDTGEQIDCVGGWYDAGDLRKWMSMTMLPALGFLDVYERLGLSWNHFAEEDIADNDLITETIWGVKFILKMQDPETGMLFEEIGGGGEARRKPGMNWWYENHSGCYADNSQNYFTDNIPNSGDERIVRVQYNPIVQYTNLTILLRTADAIEKYDKKLAQESRIAAKRIWDFTQEQKSSDKRHGWTSILSWRLCAGLEMMQAGFLEETALSKMVVELLELFSPEFGFWHMTKDKREPYRGILHSAQPLIALLRFLDYYPDHMLASTVKDVILQCWENYVKPIRKTNPFGIMPYGLFAGRFTENDHYRPWANELTFRFYMPDNSPQKINHGLGGHWTSWSHALAYAATILENDEMMHAAWDQLYWLLGNNIKNSCVISGVGYNNPMPHSRFFGTIIGGFCVGPVGDQNDEFVLDLEGRAAWNTTEYWNPPVANSLMALSFLLPKKINPKGKIS